uniref:Uncharacterized protein n=1 Tax=Arundo donax TaxID=35708 RepID=A0A0A8ZP28_ARUDO
MMIHLHLRMSLHLLAKVLEDKCIAMSIKLSIWFMQRVLELFRC